jgi:CRP/FNR family cyclic AMP-dependent transcriptional regulator
MEQLNIKYMLIMRFEWKKIRLLEKADEDVRQAIDDISWAVSHTEGEIVLWEGDVCEAVYFIVSGAVEIYRTALDGREHTLEVLKAGDTFNLVPALMASGMNRASARCKGKTDLLRVNKPDLQAILSNHPQFAVEMLQVMAERLAGMTSKAGELALHSVKQRTAAFLVRQANNASQAQGTRWTRDDMARQIGTVRDMVGRTLRQFEEKGFIKREKGNIMLIERGGLVKIMNGEDAT